MINNGGNAFNEGQSNTPPLPDKSVGKQHSIPGAKPSISKKSKDRAKQDSIVKGVAEDVISKNGRGLSALSPLQQSSPHYYPRGVLLHPSNYSHESNIPAEGETSGSSDPTEPRVGGQPRTVAPLLKDTNTETKSHHNLRDIANIIDQTWEDHLFNPVNNNWPEDDPYQQNQQNDFNPFGNEVWLDFPPLTDVADIDDDVFKYNNENDNNEIPGLNDGDKKT